MSFKTVSLLALTVALTLLLTEADRLSTEAHTTGAGKNPASTAPSTAVLGVSTSEPVPTQRGDGATTQVVSGDALRYSTQSVTSNESVSPTVETTAAISAPASSSTSSATQILTTKEPTERATFSAIHESTQAATLSLAATQVATSAATSPYTDLKLAESGRMGLNNWYTSLVTVKVVNPSGPVEFSLDGGPFQVEASIQISADGKHLVVARYADGEGQAVSVEVDVDQTPPVFDETHADTQEGVHVDSLSGHDDVSGLAQAYVDGDKLVLIDNAGNRAERVIAP